MRNPSPISTSSPRAMTISATRRAQRGGDEGERGRAVVDQVRGACGGDGGEQRGDRPAAAGAARTGGQVQLDVAGPGGDVEGVPGGGGERRAAEVGVQQHAGGVEHRPQGGGGGGQPVEDGVDDGLGGDLAAPDPLLRGRRPPP